MLEVGTGFHPELTGRENIYLNGAILGMRRKEVDEKFDQIVEFSECEKFIDTPIKRYSSGMYMKLAFAIAAHLDSDIVLMDEVLAVGDLNFRNKCMDKIREIASSGRTILLVSHSIHRIRMLCDRCIFLDNGKLDYEGSVEESVHRYVKEDIETTDSQDIGSRERTLKSDGLCMMERVELLDGRPGNKYEMGSKLHFALEWTCAEELPEMCLRIGVWTSDKMAVAISHSEPFKAVTAGWSTGVNRTEVELDTSGLEPGRYTLELIIEEIFDDGDFNKHDALREAVAFSVEAPDDRPLFERYNNSWGYIELPAAKITANE